LSLLLAIAGDEGTLSAYLCVNLCNTVLSPTLGRTCARVSDYTKTIPLTPLLTEIF